MQACTGANAARVSILIHRQEEKLEQQAISAKTREFIGRFVRESDFDDNLNLFESGVVNSLFAMQLVMFVEQEFDIKVSDEDLELANFESVNAIADFVVSKNQI